ncbi:MAG: sterol desaturase family protein, partial [Deltaproteobacteria bacterium]|nr:sterol desaturase family protein [Deltaproteobacteria bacterium]
MGYPEPTLYAVPFFLLTLWLEPRLLRTAAERGRPVLGYERRDARASLGMGLWSVFFVAGINLATFAVAGWLHERRLFDLGTGALGWVVAMVGWDLSYYLHHRAEHEIRILWACHVNHHSSRYYNLSTALRQPWTPFAAVLFYPGWALLGVEPWM